MTAASIKMDELLVNWLAGDAVYSHILEWVENYSTTTATTDRADDNESLEQHEPQQPQIKAAFQIGSSGHHHDPDTDGSSSSSSRQRQKEDPNNNSAVMMMTVVPPFYTVRNKLERLPPRKTTAGPLLSLSNAMVGATVAGSNTAGTTAGGPAAAATTAAAAIPSPPENATISSSSLMMWSEAQPLVEIVFRDNAGNLDVVAAVDGEPNGYSLIPDSFVRVTKEICRFPSYFNSALYQRILDLHERERTNAQQQNQQPGSNHNPNSNNSMSNNSGGSNSSSNNNSAGVTMIVTYKMFHDFWMTEMEPYDEVDRFFRLMKQPDADAIVKDDFFPFLKALLSDHPGLEFLSSHDEFQEKYAISIITRIFYFVNTSHSGSITARQLRRSDLLEAFQVVDEEEDINKIPRYFSYEHFYVLYCRFWELDDDRDYRITRDNLLKYGEHSLSHMIVDRIFEAAPRPFGPESIAQREYLTFEDFIYFMLAEEDKANEVSIRYWFDCLDVDADGKLNNMEMRSFYAVQLHRMQCMGHEIVPFEDMLCQMMDMIKPANPDYLVVSDFLQKECVSGVSGVLFDALFNLNKYLMFEQRDPFVERQKREDEFQTEWDRFANADYNRLAMEEEARDEEAMEIDWVTVDEEEEAAAAAADDRRSMNQHTPAIEAPF